LGTRYTTNINKAKTNKQTNKNKKHNTENIKRMSKMNHTKITSG